MIRRLLLIALPILLLAAASIPARAEEGGDFNANIAIRQINDPKQMGFLGLCYHNVSDKNLDETYVDVSTARLVEQFSWLQLNGYHPVSIDDILIARQGGKPLPDKAVLLTFDDGFESFYTRVYPVLKAFHYPAIEALVGVWLGPAGPDGKVPYGETGLDRSMFLTWDQIREMNASGLVEFAAHSNEQHHGIKANPQGNSEAAAVTRRYDPESGNYESEAAYEQRLNIDFATIAATMEHEIGKRPRLMVWPYGQYNDTAIAISTAYGMPITLTLSDGTTTLDHLKEISRHLVNANPNIGDYVSEIRDINKIDPVRVVQVDLDYVYDADPAQQERNLGALINRIYAEGINAVFLQAFADPSGDGLARELYFPNRHLPMRADLFNRVAWQLHTRAKVKVFAWMPVLAYDLGPGTAEVAAWDPATGKIAPDAKAYHRVSPFDPAARQKIIDLYEDLARAAPFDGILFHDDAMLSDFEDASPAALAAYAQAGFPSTIAAIRSDPQTMQRWTWFKEDTLTNFTKELLAHAELYRKPLITARNIYAGPVLDPASEAWFGQRFANFLDTYDYVALEAMPFMENIPDGNSETWLKALVKKVAAEPGALPRTIFELQTIDWRKPATDQDRFIPTETIAGQMRLLARMGALNFGYYPDDFAADHPDVVALHRDFSLQSYPYQP